MLQVQEDKSSGRSIVGGLQPCDAERGLLAWSHNLRDSILCSGASAHSCCFFSPSFLYSKSLPVIVVIIFNGE